MNQKRAPSGSGLVWIRSVVESPWPETCCVYPFGRDPDGYGCVRGGSEQRAHRVAYRMAFGGPPPAETPMVLHRCKQQRACCNPRHLYAGTAQQNSDDRKRDGTVARGDTHFSRTQPERLARGDRNGMRVHPEARRQGDEHWSAKRPDEIVKGEQIGTSKLTAAEVLEIRRRAALGESRASLASAFGVCGMNIRFIVIRRSWKHL